MKLKDVIKELGLEVMTGEDKLDCEIRGGYASDLLSDVLAHTRRGDLWITLQIHQNIIAVAQMNELAGIVIINGRRPEKDTIDRARREKVPVLVSRLPAFEIIGKLYSMGITGMKENAEGV